MYIDPTQTNNKDLEKIDQLIAELEGIFGKPKILTEEEQAVELELLQRMDKIWEDAFKDVGDNGFTIDPEKLLSSAQKAQLAEIDKQLNELYGIKSYDDLSKEEQTRVDEINAELDALIPSSGFIIEPLPEDSNEASEDTSLPEEIASLYERLDEIFGVPKQELSESELEKEKQISQKIEAIFANNESGILSEKEEAQLNELFTELDSLYGIRSFDSLSDKEKAEVEEIYSKIDEYYSSDVEHGGCSTEMYLMDVELNDAIFG